MTDDQFNSQAVWPVPDSPDLLFTGCTGNCDSRVDVLAWDDDTASIRMVVENAWMVGWSEDRIVYAAPSGGAYAVAFDPETLSTSGEPVLVLPGVDPRALIFSENGTAVYSTLAAAARKELRWVARDGTFDVISTAWDEDPDAESGRWQISDPPASRRGGPPAVTSSSTRRPGS